MDENTTTGEFSEEVPILPEDVPVIMPDLPERMVINTVPQFKALSDPVRLRIVNVIRHQPATAKQLADTLGASPGAIGHHLKVLEEAGVIKLVARRLTRGIVAKYYTRAARLYEYQYARDLTGETSVEIDILNHARDELVEAAAESQDYEKECYTSFPHARLSPERVEYYQKRVQELMMEFLQEPINTDYPVYGLSLALFRSPKYMQGPATLPGNEKPE